MTEPPQSTQLPSQKRAALYLVFYLDDPEPTETIRLAFHSSGTDQRRFARLSGLSEGSMSELLSGNRKPKKHMVRAVLLAAMMCGVPVRLAAAHKYLAESIKRPSKR